MITRHTKSGTFVYTGEIQEFSLDTFHDLFKFKKSDLGYLKNRVSYQSYKFSHNLIDEYCFVNIIPMIQGNNQENWVIFRLDELYLEDQKERIFRIGQSKLLNWLKNK